jgi:hypothetical protein
MTTCTFTHPIDSTPDIPTRRSDRPVLALAAALVSGLLLNSVVPALAAEASSGPEAAVPSAPAPAAPAGNPSDEPGKLRHLAPTEAASVLGRPVRGPDGHDVGRIVDVLVDQAGHPRAAVIDFGGFLGVGSRKVAVDWHLLHFTPGDTDKPTTLDLTTDQIKAAPEYKSGTANPTIVAAPSSPSHPAGSAASAQPPGGQGASGQPPGGPAAPELKAGGTVTAPPAAGSR